MLRLNTCTCAYLSANTINITQPSMPTYEAVILYTLIHEKIFADANVWCFGCKEIASSIWRPPRQAVKISQPDAYNFDFFQKRYIL